MKRPGGGLRRWVGLVVNLCGLVILIDRGLSLPLG